MFELAERIEELKKKNEVILEMKDVTKKLGVQILQLQGELSEYKNALEKEREKMKEKDRRIVESQQALELITKDKKKIISKL